MTNDALREPKFIEVTSGRLRFASASVQDPRTTHYNRCAARYDMDAVCECGLADATVPLDSLADVVQGDGSWHHKGAPRWRLRVEF